MTPKLNTSRNQISTMCSSKEQSLAMCSKVLTSHTYHVGHCVKYQVNTSKQWYPATIISLCSEKGTYHLIRATNGTVYREMQANLKPYQFQDRNCPFTQCEYMWPVELAMTQSSHIWSVKPAMPQASHMWPVKVIDQSNHKKFQMKQASSTSRNKLVSSLK